MARNAVLMRYSYAKDMKPLDGPYARSEGEKRFSVNEVVDYSILRSLR